MAIIFISKVGPSILNEEKTISMGVFRVQIVSSRLDLSINSEAACSTYRK